MARRRKIETPPEPQVIICPGCGAEIEPGHFCKCPEGRKAFAKKLYDKYYGRRKKKDEDYWT